MEDKRYVADSILKAHAIIKPYIHRTTDTLNSMAEKTLFFKCECFQKGVAIAAKSINPAIRVLAAEPKGVDDATQSKASGRIITLSETNTIADGLLASLGDLTWPIVRDFVDDIIIVDDKDIVQAMRYCFEILKVVVEPSGAIGLAAVLSDKLKKNPILKNSQNIGIVLSGGNADLSRYARSLEGRSDNKLY